MTQSAGEDDQSNQEKDNSWGCYAWVFFGVLIFVGGSILIPFVVTPLIIQYAIITDIGVLNYSLIWFSLAAFFGFLGIIIFVGPTGKFPTRLFTKKILKPVSNLIFREDQIDRNVTPSVKPTEETTGEYKFIRSLKLKDFLLPTLVTIFCFTFAGISLGPLFSSGDKSLLNIFAGLLAILMGLIGLFVIMRHALLLTGSNKEEIVFKDWPLKLGQKVKVTYKRNYYEHIELSGITGRLICTAKIPVEDGTNGMFTLYDEELFTKSLSMKEGTIPEDISFRIPWNGCPSFYRSAHNYEWKLLFSLKSATGTGDDVHYEDSEYKLQVIPEIVTGDQSNE